MECVGGAAAVARGKYFPPGLKGVGDKFSSTFDLGQTVLGIGYGLYEFGVLAGDDWIHREGKCKANSINKKDSGEWELLK